MVYLVVFKDIWGHSVDFSQNGLYLETAGHKAEWSAIWDSRIIVTHICGALDLVGFKVIWGPMAHLSQMVCISKITGRRVQKTNKKIGTQEH